jgi:hypothetical protein
VTPTFQSSFEHRLLSAGGTSINHVCDTIDESSDASTVREHLTDQFDLDAVEAVGDTLLQGDVLEHFLIDW